MVIEGGRAVGVEFERGGRDTWRPGARSCSRPARWSRPLLERSGVGDGARLADLGVAVAHHAPGVGENLQDHLQIRPVYKVTGVPTLNLAYKNLVRRAWMGVEYALFRRGPLTMAPSQVGAFARSSPDYATANLEYHFQPLSLDKWGDGLHRFGAITASVCNLRPSSRGSVHAAGPDPKAPPAIRPNYLATEEDRRVAVDSLKLTRRIMAASPLARFRPEEHLPGPGIAGDADLLKAAGDLGTTIFHPVGTARMGPTTTRGRCSTRGCASGASRGLRVVDASVMPRIVSGNTNSPTIMIAEKGAAALIEDRGRP